MVRKSNADNVRAYYARHKKDVLFRKVIKRCRDTGAMPHIKSVREYDIPIISLMISFADWVSNNPSATHLITRQSKKLSAIRTEFANRVTQEFDGATSEEVKLTSHLERVVAEAMKSQNAKHIKAQIARVTSPNSAS